MALAYTADPNRSTDINFVHVNSRSVYVDWRMAAVEEGTVVHHVKGRGFVCGKLCPWEKCPDPRKDTGIKRCIGHLCIHRHGSICSSRFRFRFAQTPISFIRIAVAL